MEAGSRSVWLTKRQRRPRLGGEGFSRLCVTAVRDCIKGRLVNHDASALVLDLVQIA